MDKLDVQYVQQLYKLCSDWFIILTGRMNIGKVEKLLANSYDKKEYTIFCKIVMFEFW